MTSEVLEFFRAEIDGMLFTVSMSSTGPYLGRWEQSGYCLESVALENASIRYFGPNQPDPFIRVWGWWIVKHEFQPYIDLNLMTVHGRQELSSQFGLPFFEPSCGLPRVDRPGVFLESEAFQSLCNWVERHPRLARSSLFCQTYIPSLELA
jgi:hypothetical protein